MNELSDLYQEMILDHNRSPLNYGTLPNPDHISHGDNPLCGDKLALFLNMKGEMIDDIRFQGIGCAISTASASLMTESVKGKTREEAIRTMTQFHSMVTEEGASDFEELGKLAAFSGVREYPVRVKCATLAWHTFRAAIDGGANTVSTE
jgi:nitrogen fixation NifU-like protein